MAGEYDESFEEITGLLQKTVGGMQELRMEVRDLRNEVRDVRTDLAENVKETKSVGQKVDALASQFKYVGGMAIEDHPRIDSLEKRMDVLEAEAH